MVCVQGSPIHRSTLVFNRPERRTVSNAARFLYPNNDRLASSLLTKSASRGRDGPVSPLRATRGLRRMGRERPGALLARRTRTI